MIKKTTHFANRSILMVRPPLQQQRRVVLNSFRLFLLVVVVGSCSMGCMMIVLHVFKQQQDQQQQQQQQQYQESTLPSTTISSLIGAPTTLASKTSRQNRKNVIMRPTNIKMPRSKTTSPLLSTNNKNKNNSKNNNTDAVVAVVWSLLEFINTSAGQLYHPPQFPECLYLLTTTTSTSTTTAAAAVATAAPESSFVNVNATTATSSTFTLWQSMNGYWKHPVGIRRRQLTLNLQLLQDAVHELKLQQQQQQQLQNHQTQTDAATSSFQTIWSALQATSTASSSFSSSSTTSNMALNTSSSNKEVNEEDDNNNNNTNLAFARVPQLGMIPLLIEWKPTVSFLPTIISSSKTTTTTTTNNNNSSTMLLSLQPPSSTACFANGNFHKDVHHDNHHDHPITSNVFILRNVISQPCCNADYQYFHHRHYKHQHGKDGDNDDHNDENDNDNNNDNDNEGPLQHCSNYLTVPNAPLIQQVKTVEQQLINARRSTKNTNNWASCSLAWDKTDDVIQMKWEGSSSTPTTVTTAALEDEEKEEMFSFSRRHRRRSSGDDNNNMEMSIVGVRIPQFEEKEQAILQEPFLSWLRNLQKDAGANSADANANANANAGVAIEWQLNQHEDEHDIILDLSSNWTLFCQPHVLIIKPFPPTLVDMFTFSLDQWKDFLFIPISREALLLQDDNGKFHKSTLLLWEGVRRAVDIGTHNATKRQQMLQHKLCWCGQHMKYQKLVQQVLNAWAYYCQRILLDGNHQVWKREFLSYAKGHFWKRPGGDSWSLPLSVVGGIKGGLRADSKNKD